MQWEEAFGFTGLRNNQIISFGVFKGEEGSETIAVDVVDGMLGARRNGDKQVTFTCFPVLEA